MSVTLQVEKVSRSEAFDTPRFGEEVGLRDVGLGADLDESLDVARESLSGNPWAFNRTQAQQSGE